MIQVFDPNSNKTGKAGIIYVRGKKVIFVYLNGKRIFPSSIIDNTDYNLELIGNHCSTCIDAKTTSTVSFEGTTFADSESNVGTTRVMIPDGLVGENITIKALPFLGYKFKYWLNNLATDNLAISSNSTFTYKWSNYTTLTAYGEVDYDYCFIVFENLSIGDFDIINNNPMANDRHLEISYTWDTYRGVDNEKKYLSKLMAKIPVKTPIYTDSSPDIPTENVTTNIIIRSYNINIYDWVVTYQEAASSTINFLNPNIVEEEGYKHLHLDTLPGGTVYVVKAYKEGSEDTEDTQITMYIDDNHSVYNTGTGTIQVWLDDEELSPVETITTYKLYRVQGRIGQIVRFKATPDDGSIFNGWDMGTQAYDMPTIQSSEHSITLKISDNETSYHARFIKSSEEGGEDTSEVTLRFFDSDGTEYTSLKITTSTETAIMPTPPSKANYTFVTWHYGSINGTTTLNAGDTNTGVTQQEDWYAEWELNSTTVEVTEVTLNKTSTSLTVGDTDTLIATVVPSNATNKTVTWSTNNSSVATVSDGVVTGKSSGTATITATAGGYSATCTVSVTNATIAVTGISLDQTSAQIAVDKSITLTATVLPTNATDKTITWTTSNSSIASVNNGTITGKSTGTATITATAGSKSATCSVTVVTTGTNGWVGSASAGTISAETTSFNAVGSTGNILNTTSASIETLRYRVYNSDGITYTDNTPSISYSWSVNGEGLSTTGGSNATTTITYANRGTTTGNKRTGTIVRRAKFTYGNYTTTLDSTSVSVSQQANVATKVDDGTTYGIPTLTLTNNLTAAGGSITCESSVTNVESYHYTYTSGSNSAVTNTNKAGTVILSIDSQSCAGVTSNRFTISSSTVSHSSMTTYVGTDSVTIKAVNTDATSKYTTKTASVSNAITETNKQGSIVSISMREVDSSGMDSPSVLAASYNTSVYPNYFSYTATYNKYDVYTSGSQKNTGTMDVPNISPGFTQPSWVTSIESVNLNGVTGFKINLTTNSSTSERSGDIVATYSDKTYTMTIKQLGKPAPTTQSIAFNVANVIWDKNNYSQVTFVLRGYASPTATITNVKVIATTSTGNEIITTWKGASYTLTSDYADMPYDPDSGKLVLKAATIRNIDYNTTFKISYTCGGATFTKNLGIPKEVISPEL